VVCSACGFENLQGMRFCGMCGTPLPHRPLTAPGAQSTLSFTHGPLESGATVHDHSPVSASLGVLEMPGASSEAPPDNGIREEAANDGEATPQPPARELVPDIPLDEYLRTFRYEPPSEPAEITMRGDAHVAEPVEAIASSESPGLSVTTDEGTTDAAGTPPVKVAAADEIKTDVPVVSSAGPVESRLGLEPEGPAEERVERPRFLDLSEPRNGREATPSSSAKSTIGGPSFLGLSDAPQAETEDTQLEVEESAGGHWRLWLAAAMVLVFAGLGWMEWRSQSYQNGSGPMQVIKAKLRNWKNARSPEPPNAAASNPSSNANSQPEMQVQEQPNPQVQMPAAEPSGPPKAVEVSPASSTATTADANGATPAATSPATTPASAGALPSSASPGVATGKKASSVITEQAAGQNAHANSTEGTPAAKSAKAGGERSSDALDGPVKPMPGSEELAKSKSASDSAASAAWLWKATAKGNPDAPVNLADMYIKGEGVPRSCEQAVVLLKTAAEKENARARTRLAALYETGSCVQRNRVEAYRWISSALAANPNSEWARQNRELIWQQMTPDERAAAARYR